MAVPGVVVHRLEGHASGLYGSPTWIPQCSVRRRPVRVEEPAVVSVPVLTLQDPLAAVGAVVLDCRPPLLPVSMNISGVDLSAVWFPAMSATMDDLLPGHEQLSTGPRYRPGGQAADSSWFPGGGHRRGHAFVSDVGRRRGCVAWTLLGGGVLPAMVMPIVDPAVGFSLSPATYAVPPVPLMSVGGSCWFGGGESSSERDPVAPGFPTCFGGFLWTAPSSSASRPAPDVSPPSSLAAAEPEFPWSTALPLELSAESTILPAPLTPSRMVGGWLFLGRWCPPRPGIPRWLEATRDCPICLWRAPLTCTRIGQCRGLLRECWMVCGVGSTA